jgi:hypothetical protein
MPDDTDDGEDRGQDAEDDEKSDDPRGEGGRVWTLTRGRGAQGLRTDTQNWLISGLIQINKT